MTAPAILPRLRAAGAEVALRGGKVVIFPASAVPPALLVEAKARRGELLTELAFVSFVSTTSKELPEIFPDEVVERAAIQAEATPVRRIRKRPMSWGQADDEPDPGDYCGCCHGLLWWTDTPAPDGWWCCWCHPSGHLAAGQFRVVAT